LLGKSYLIHKKRRGLLGVNTGEGFNHKEGGPKRSGGTTGQLLGKLMLCLGNITTIKPRGFLYNLNKKAGNVTRKSPGKARSGHYFWCLPSKNQGVISRAQFSAN
jgi:hypothetical protein